MTNNKERQHQSRIHKYELNQDKQFTIIELPYQHQILSIKIQQNKVVLYVMVKENEEPNFLITVERVPTGDRRDFIFHKTFMETTVMPNGLVWHWFI